MMKSTTTLLLSLVCLFLVVDQVSAQRRTWLSRFRPRCVVIQPSCCPPIVEPSCGLPTYAAPSPMTPTIAASANSVEFAPSALPAGSIVAAPGPLTDSVSSDLGATPTPALATSPEVGSPSDGSVGGDLMLKKDDAKEWKSLFNGKELGDWEITRFGGEGEVSVENGQIVCDFGQYITGVTYKGKDLPTNNYEVELEAQRVEGSDFFCGITFPVDDTHATFVCGGWGGSVTGISSIDQYDASENDTTDYMQFKNKVWYKIRVRVTKGVLEAWINDKKMVSKEVDSKQLSVRLEVDPSKPLGICCFDTQAAYRNIRIRKETEPETKPKSE